MAYGMPDACWDCKTEVATACVSVCPSVRTVSLNLLPNVLRVFNSLSKPRLSTPEICLFKTRDEI